ncbi:MAG: HlyU family transcriptional regulator [Hyphomicrobiales bacterium]
MSFLKKLFGGTDSNTQGEGFGKNSSPSVSYKGYEIVAKPKAEGGQFRLAGKITKEIDGTLKEHFLVRADVFSSLEEAVRATESKAKYLIDEQGEYIF